jgi:hypothetical protein
MNNRPNQFIFFSLIALLLFSCKKEVNRLIVEAETGKDLEFFAQDAKSNYDIRWDFGDGTVASGIRVNHAYTSPGNYVVRYTEYTKNGRFVRNTNAYLVNVVQIYRPYLLGAEAYSINYDYLYANKNSTMSMLLTDEMREEGYTYRIQVENPNNAASPFVYDEEFINHIFDEVGNYQVRFSVFDKYGTEGFIDTSLFVGDEQTSFNFTIPDAFLSQLGATTEKYLIVHEFDFRHFTTLSRINEYPGPSYDLLVKNNELFTLYSTNPFDWYHSSTFNPDVFQNLPAVADGMSFSFDYPSYVGTQDKDELYVIAVIVGSSKKAVASIQMNFIPGGQWAYTLNLSVSNY